MPIAAIIGAAATLGGAALQSSAANNAAKQQAQASAANLAFQQQVYGNAQQNLQPFVGYGQSAGGQIQNLLAGNPAAFDAFRNSTNYQFLLNQGLQGQAYLNAPNLFSGATGKAFNNYAQGMAGNALGGYENLLQNQEGLGIGAAGTIAGVGENIAQQQAQARNLQAGAQGTANLIGGNAFGGALGQLFGQSSYGGGGFGNQIGNALRGLFGQGGFNPSPSALTAFTPNPSLDTAFSSALGGLG